MPVSQPPADWRGRWLPILFWVGVGMAPLASLLLLVGQGGAVLRVAAVLAIMCVVCIGLSIALRTDDTVRAELENVVWDEADAIREETREDIVAVARKLHSAVRAEMTDLAGELDRMRHQAPAGPRRVPDLSNEAAEYTRGLVSRTETVHVTRETTVSGDRSRRRDDHEPARPAASWSGRATPTGSWSQQRPAAASWSEPTRPEPPAREPRRPAPYRPDRAGAGPKAIEPARQYADPARTAARERSWDPLTDDLADAPASYGSAPASATPPGPGRRRAPERDAPVPIAELEPARRSDPWADLRGTTPEPPPARQPARLPAYDRPAPSYRTW